MVIYKKKVMLHLGAEWSSKQNILICRRNFGRTRPAVRF